MPVKRDESGRRWVQAEVEVPGTPEQVWEAIASGPGISSWFMPAEVDGREGGKTVLHFGPESSMDLVATIAEWDPPRRWVATSRNDPAGPEIATQWIVEARSGGTCVVRVVHSWFADTDDWDGHFEGTESGWVSFFRILRLHLEHFAGQPVDVFQLMGTSTDGVAAAWQAIVDSLGIAPAVEGERVTVSGDAPRFAGRVVYSGPAEKPELLIHLDAPSPGIAHMMGMSMGGSTMIFVRLFFFGSDSAAAASREEPRWQAWMASIFPATQEA
jgi:uncharacterized protein YndB with AHSA1/START domain